jgi:RAB protein geranylgeranyltransferase component A
MTKEHIYFTLEEAKRIKERLEAGLNDHDGASYARIDGIANVVNIKPDTNTIFLHDSFSEVIDAMEDLIFDLEEFYND